MPAAEKTRDTIPADEVQGIIAAAVAAELEKAEQRRAAEISEEVGRQLAAFKDTLSASVPQGRRLATAISPGWKRWRWRSPV